VGQKILQSGVPAHPVQLSSITAIARAFAITAP